MGEKNSCYHQNGGETFPGELHHGGLCDPIGIDIFATHDKRHGICVFASSFLLEIKISPTHCRNLTYDGGKEIWPRTTRTGDISLQEMPKFAMCKQRAY